MYIILCHSSKTLYVRFYVCEYKGSLKYIFVFVRNGTYYYQYNTVHSCQKKFDASTENVNKITVRNFYFTVGFYMNSTMRKNFFLKKIEITLLSRETTGTVPYGTYN